jgi:nucleoid DNA-binding protein
MQFTRKQIVDILAKEHGCAKQLANNLLGSFFKLVMDAALAGDTVKTPLGTFTGVRMNERRMVIPGVGERILPPRTKLKLIRKRPISVDEVQSDE